MSFYEIVIVAGSAGAGVAVGTVSTYLSLKGRKKKKKSDAREKNSSNPESASENVANAVTIPDERQIQGSNGSQSSQLVEVLPPQSDSVQGNSTTLELDSKPEEGKQQQDIQDRNPSRTIPKSELEKRRRELRTLILEKELVSAALTRLYEAEAAKEITKDERETLASKYRAELKSLNDRISKIDAFIQIGDLETLRNQLLQLVTEKIEAIERRIESTRELAKPLIDEILSRQGGIQPANPSEVEKKRKAIVTASVPDISDLLEGENRDSVGDGGGKSESQSMSQENESEKPVQPIGLSPKQAVSDGRLQPSTGASDTPRRVERKRPADRVEELQKELLEALDRLEKLDVEMS